MIDRRCRRNNNIHTASTKSSSSCSMTLCSNTVNDEYDDDEVSCKSSSFTRNYSHALHPKTSSSRKLEKIFIIMLCFLCSFLCDYHDTTCCRFHLIKGVYGYHITNLPTRMMRKTNTNIIQKTFIHARNNNSNQRLFVTNMNNYNWINRIDMNSRTIGNKRIQSKCTTTITSSSLFTSIPPVRVAATETNLITTNNSSDDHLDNNNIKKSFLHRIRNTLRKMTGFSLTAFRTTIRTMTGISLTTIYLTTFAMTNTYVRSYMKVILDYIPASIRYFIQPILILYYVPLILIRNFCRKYGIISKQQQLHKHNEQKHHDDELINSWKQAVTIADETLSYWPIHVTNVTAATLKITDQHQHHINNNNQSPIFYQDISELNPIDAIIESIEVASEIEQQQQKQKTTK